LTPDRYRSAQLELMSLAVGIRWAEGGVPFAILPAFVEPQADVFPLHVGRLPRFWQAVPTQDWQLNVCASDG
jgi:hypothetical protein